MAENNTSTRENPESGAETVKQALCKTVRLVDVKQSNTEHRTIGGDEW